jgi:ribosomal protein S18 acetylase RimI-like enzyme
MPFRASTRKDAPLNRIERFAVGATDDSEIDMIHIPGAEMLMRVAPGSSMRLVDLRQLSVHQLNSLLDEEAALWRSELHWDYQFSIDLIKKFLDMHSLAGVVAYEDERPAGYGFYVVEDHKGMLGGLFVSPRYAQTGIGEQILGDIVQTLRGTPQVTRIEAQLMPFGASLEGLLTRNDFRLFPRHFMLYDLGGHVSASTASSPGLRIERWHEKHMAPCAELIHLTYANHIDGAINDQYRSQAGAVKFLKNIVILPGCGQFEARASFVLRDELSAQLIGVVLTSMVAPGVGHTTQLCVLPGHQGHGLGRRLMLAAMDALKEQRATELSLTVTSSNERAVKLYEELGFRKLKTFVAGVWAA